MRARIDIPDEVPPTDHNRVERRYLIRTACTVLNYSGRPTEALREVEALDRHCSFGKAVRAPIRIEEGGSPGALGIVSQHGCADLPRRATKYHSAIGYSIEFA